MPESFITTAQAAELTGKHEETIRRWCRSGKLKAKKFNHEFLIYSSEFEKAKTREEENREIANYVIGT